MNFFLVGINIFELFNIFISHEKPDFFSIVALLDKRDVTSGSLNFYSGGKMYFNDLGACIWISTQRNLWIFPTGYQKPLQALKINSKKNLRKIKLWNLFFELGLVIRPKTLINWAPRFSLKLDEKSLCHQEDPRKNISKWALSSWNITTV